MDLDIQGQRARVYTGGRAFDPALPTVVFIHGGAHDHSVWALQTRYLAHHGFGVLAVDLPGHGRSAGGPLDSIAAMADWIAAMLDAAGVRQAALVGHSMGSLVALDCAARHPARVSRLALIGATFPMHVSPELLAAARDDEARAHDMINVWSYAAIAHFPSSPGPGGWAPGVNLRLLQWQKPGVLHADFRACNDYADGLERAAAVRCPVLLVQGERDLMTPPRSAAALTRAFADARSVLLPGSGHALMAEAPDGVLDALREFLAAPASASHGGVSQK